METISGITSSAEGETDGHFTTVSQRALVADERGPFHHQVSAAEVQLAVGDVPELVADVAQKYPASLERSRSRFPSGRRAQPGSICHLPAVRPAVLPGKRAFSGSGVRATSPNAAL
jgi:hypothetical protein